MWNQLIFEKYRKQVKINEEYLKDRLEALIEIERRNMSIMFMKYYLILKK